MHFSSAVVHQHYVKLIYGVLLLIEINDYSMRICKCYILHLMISISKLKKIVITAYELSVIKLDLVS